MLIALTGTPGVGKTEVANLLKKKYRVESVLSLAEKYGCILDFDELSERNGKGCNENGREVVVDVERLAEEIKGLDGIVEGHLSHLLNPDLVIVLRCNPIVLKERLKKRGWSEEKVMENVEAELLDVILVEAIEVTDNVYEIDTTEKSVEEVARDVEEIIEGGEEIRSRFKPKVDWLSLLEDRLEEVVRDLG